MHRRRKPFKKLRKLAEKEQKDFENYILSIRARSEV
jgi:hypothetical protein